MPSVKAHPAIVQQFIDSELREGRMFGPFAPDEIQYPVHISRFGVIEKKNQPGKFRLIVDLPYPPGMSVNDGKSPELSSMSYTKVDDVVARKTHKIPIRQRSCNNCPRHQEL